MFVETKASEPRFFGRRRGKRLRSGALGLVQNLLPQVEVPRLDVKEGGRLDVAALFSTPVKDIWLEVGFGGGEHLAEQALRYPEVGFIGCEPFQNGIASLLGHLSRLDIENVRIFPDDVRQLFPALGPGTLGRVFVLFPDPWPKSRHTERRFIGPEMLNVLAQVMTQGGELRVASDDPVYQVWAKKHLLEHPAFEEVQITRVREDLPEDWPVTRYEEKCLSGKPPVFFRFQRRCSG